MSTNGVITLVAIVVAAVIAIAVVWWIMAQRRRRELQERFGDEYDRVVVDLGGTRQAEHELTARAARHDTLRITPLTPQRREQFTTQWRAAQAQFVDEPSAALDRADTLVQRVMAERGYPIGNFDQQAADLSVEHADVLDHYRQAHTIADRSRAGRTKTEDLRQGMVHYRALFTALLEDTIDAERS